jgi:general secretion pathway protein G
MVARRSQQRESGFTLIELMIVISLILILASVAVPIYKQSILKSKEAVLRQDLFTMRQVIDQYTLDKQKAPQALDDLVSAGYMRQLPVDPFTARNDTWVPVEDQDIAYSPDQTDVGGISDVHSGSNLTSSDGTPYSSW